MTNNKSNYVNQLHIQKDHHLTAVTGAGVLLGSTVLLGQQTKVHAAKNNESATDHTVIVNKNASSQQKQIQLHHTSVVSAASQSASVASQQSAKNISAASQAQASQSSTKQQSQATNHNSQTKSSVSNSQAQTNHNQSNAIVKSTIASQQPSQSQMASSAVNKNNVTSQTKPTNNNQSTTKSAGSAASESQSVNKVTTNAKSNQSNSQQAAKSMTSVTANQQTTAKSVASQSISVASQQSAKNISATSQVNQHMTSIATIQNSQLTNDVNNSTNTTKAQDLQRLQTLLQTEANYAANNYQEAFIEQIANAAIAIANKYDLYPSVMMAQAILESGWGQSGLSINANNYFGVKGSYNGQSVDVPTQEWNGYQMVTINDYFKKYPNAEASFEDYAKVFTGSAWARNFYRGVFRKNAPTYQDATAWLTGRYATDPNYNVKLNQLIQEYDLSRFDQQVTNTPNSNGVIDTDNTNADTSKPQTPQKTYIVKSGDTVWSISQQFDTTVKQIVSWNNLTNANVIYVGQVLNVSAPVAQQTNSDNKQNDHQNQTNNDDTTITYTVKSGDTVWGISQKYQVSTAQIAQLNHLSNDNIIYVGQVLTIKQGHHSNNQINNNSNNTTSQNQNTYNNAYNDNATVTYTVKSGDTLWGISQQFNTTVSRLQSTNHINGSTIYVGQTLTISGNQVNNDSSTSQSQTTNSSSYQNTTYTVKAGDTLWGISQEYNTSVNKLMSANHLNDTTIYAGQVLDINPVASGNVTLSRPQVQQNSAYYTAKAGDSLWSIAQANDTSVNDLKQLNHLSSDMILVGQRLRVR